MECLQRYQNDWSVRIYEQLQQVGFGLFVTLTYREKVRFKDFKNIYPYASKNMPLPPIQCVPRVIDKTTGETFRTVYKKHVQDALKRFREFRRKKGLTNSFSYFITAEYGPRTARPHYHAIIFGLKYSDFLPFLQDWQYRYGNTRADVITYSKKSHFNTARYLAKYCSKGVFENPLVAQKKVFKCFKLISKKLGYSYVERMYKYHRLQDLPDKMVRDERISRIVDRMYYKYVSYDKVTGAFNEIHYALPKYYKEYIFGKKNLLRYQLLQEVFRRNDALYQQQLEQVQSQRNCTTLEAVHLIGLQILRDTVYKEEQLRVKLAKYYDKAKL